MTDIQQFAVAMSREWAWPLMAAVSILLMRDVVRQLAIRLRRASYRDWHADFGEELAMVEKSVDEVATSNPEPKVEEEPGEYQKFREALTLDPSYAILLAWQAVEADLISLARSKDISGHQPSQLLRQLVKAEAIDGKTEELIRSLSLLRNRVVHKSRDAESVSIVEAERYRELSLLAQSALRHRASS